MKKTIFINLAGRNFSIEENAQERLADYLDGIRQHCGVDVDVDEVMSDIEIGLSDKLKNKLNDYKNVITLEDVEKLIGIMGTTDDFDREIGGGEKSPQPKNNRRRLYRDIDNAILGGVASGLGAYFNIDPVLFRLLFVGLVFAGGSGFLLYLIMWLITPAAKSAYEKLEMRGEAPTVAAFERLAKTGKKTGEKIKRSWRNGDFGRIISLPLSIMENFFGALKRFFNALWPIARTIIGIIMVLAAVILLGFLGTAAAYSLLQAGSHYRFMYVPIKELIESFPFTYLAITVFLSLAIPSVLIFFGGLILIRRKNFLNIISFSVLVGLWIISAAISIALIARYAPDLKNKIESYPEITKIEKKLNIGQINSISADGQNLRINISISSSTPSLKIKGRQIDIEQLAITENNGFLNIIQTETEAEKTCLACEPEIVVVEITLSELAQIKTEKARLTINEPKGNLDVEANFHGRIKIINPSLSNLKIKSVNDAEIYIEGGKSASTTAIIDNGILESVVFNSDNLDIAMSGENSRVGASGKIGNLEYFSDASCRNYCHLNFSEATINRVAINDKGASVIILGSVGSLEADISDESFLLYGGQPKINGELQEKNVMRYEKISETTYYNLQQNSQEENFELNSLNGRYYKFFRDSLSQPAFERLLDAFRSVAN